MITPAEFADALDKIGDFSHVATAEPRRMIKEFFQSATARQLSEGLRLRKVTSPFNATDIQEAYNLLNIRLQEESAQALERHISHSEKLTIQTEALIAEARNLNDQNKILVTESKKLGRFTVILIWLTVALWVAAIIQIVLMVYDIWKRK